MGATYRLAAQCAGISESTFPLWMKQGKVGQEPYAQFSEQVKIAEGQGAVEHLNNALIGFQGLMLQRCPRMVTHS
jgi:hypothetical protein